MAWGPRSQEELRSQPAFTLLPQHTTLSNYLHPTSRTTYYALAAATIRQHLHNLPPSPCSRSRYMVLTEPCHPTETLLELTKVERANDRALNYEQGIPRHKGPADSRTHYKYDPWTAGNLLRTD